MSDSTGNPLCDVRLLTEGLLQKLRSHRDGTLPPVATITQQQAEAVYGCFVTALMMGLGPFRTSIPTEVLADTLGKCGAAIGYCAGITPGQPDAQARLDALEIAGKQAMILYCMVEEQDRQTK
jgi:hypothetical protein